MPTAAQTSAAVERGDYDRTFTRLYGNEAVQSQRARYCEALQSFERIYGGSREVSLYSAPGRTEIGGNHTDHNNGLVMAAAVNLDIIAVVAKNADGFARVTSKGFRHEDTVDISFLQPAEKEFGYSSALVRGVAAGIVERGGEVGGFDAYTTSNVLRGSGLSSSAAFEVCMGAIFNGEYNEGHFTAVQLGQIGQYAENRFFGKPSGLMDQTASAVGSAVTIDFMDPAAPLVQNIPFDLSAYGYHLVVTDTKGSHAGLTDEYAAIRDEMEQVAGFFDKKVLREVDETAFLNAIPDIRRTTGDRPILRALHFFAENRRVPQLANAVKKGDFERFKTLILESGHSSFEYNQNAYSVKNPGEQGITLGLALSQQVLAGRGAWRLQGGGFAGTIQAFVPDDLLADYCECLGGVFGRDACYVLFVRPDGAIRVGI